MSVAIVTRYLGPTNHRGSRIRATVPARIAERDTSRRPDEAGYELHQPAHWTLTIPYPHELSGEAVHRVAAEALRDRLGWEGALAGGAIVDGYAFVFCGSGS